MIRGFSAALMAIALVSPATVIADPIRIGGTTSVRDSGLLDALQAAFAADTGHDMQFIVGGTGRVLKLLEAQDVSAALVHDTRSELALVESGGAAERLDVMRNDYIVLGPKQADVPAEVIPLLKEMRPRVADDDAAEASPSMEVDGEAIAKAVQAVAAAAEASGFDVKRACEEAALSTVFETRCRKCGKAPEASHTSVLYDVRGEARGDCGCRFDCGCVSRRYVHNQDCCARQGPTWRDHTC